ncbi:MAG: hypothetical protein AB1651_04865 [Pseudomonadota bacterium]
MAPPRHGDRRVEDTQVDSWTTSGLKDTETDAAGRTTRFGYDGKGQLTSVTQTVDGVDQITRYEYDQAGNKTQQIDALGRTTTWAYDNANRPIRRTLPGGQIESYGYDANGNLTAHTAFDGQVTAARLAALVDSMRCFGFIVSDLLVTGDAVSARRDTPPAPRRRGRRP